MLLLAQHGVWAHGFGHDVTKMAAHGQTQDQTNHACCLAYGTSGDAACGATRVTSGTLPAAVAFVVSVSGRVAPTFLPYSSQAPPALS